MNTIIIQLSSVYLSGVTMWESIVSLTMTSWLIFQHSDLRECTRSVYYKIFIKTNYSCNTPKITILRNAGGDISKCKQSAQKVRSTSV